ncbi:hypothetical protein DITRI_Ditri02bG0121000 [Diplodiscus trichospermus]
MASRSLILLILISVPASFASDEEKLSAFSSSSKVRLPNRHPSSGRDWLQIHQTRSDIPKQDHKFEGPEHHSSRLLV